MTNFAGEFGRGCHGSSAEGKESNISAPVDDKVWTELRIEIVRVANGKFQSALKIA